MNGHFKVRSPYARLIAATDGSAQGGMALVGAAQLAGRTNADLYVFHAAGDMGGEAAVRRQVAELLEGIPFQLEIRNLIAGTPTSPAGLVHDFADEVGHSIVVVGTHGRSGIKAALLGSTTAELVSRPGQATVVYGPHAEAPVEVTRVVACVDGSQFSELSLAEAALWCAALKVPMVIVQVVPPDLPSYVAVFEDTYVHNLSKELEGLGSQAIESEVLHSGSPAKAILESFGKDPASMLVMATHGRVGFKRVIVGSVASEVVRGARGPVVLIRPVDPTAESQD
ncbi:MAG TPA: universal stress protein [Acidimicrobiia bacterium]|nr:universal stress protein [Acidimicrobiia bacterium]